MKPLFMLIAAGLLSSPAISFAADNQSTQTSTQTRYYDNYPTTSTRNASDSERNTSTEARWQEGRFQDKDRDERRNMLREAWYEKGGKERFEDGKERFREGRDRFLDGRERFRDLRNERTSATYFEENHGPVWVKIKEVIRSDPAFASYKDAVDIIDCGDRVILFGVVDSDQAKSNLELRIKKVQGVSRIENKLIVK